MKRTQFTVLLAVAVFVLLPAGYAHALDLIISTSSSILRYDAYSGDFIDVFNKNDGGLLQRPQGLTIREGVVYASSELNDILAYYRTFGIDEHYHDLPPFGRPNYYELYNKNRFVDLYNQTRKWAEEALKREQQPLK